MSHVTHRSCNEALHEIPHVQFMRSSLSNWDSCKKCYAQVHTHKQTHADMRTQTHTDAYTLTHPPICRYMGTYRHPTRTNVHIARVNTIKQTNTHTHTLAKAHPHTHSLTGTDTQATTGRHARTYTHTLAHTYVRTRTSAHTHTHTHTYLLFFIS